MENIDLTPIKELVNKSSKILVVTHERPTFDSLAAMLALGQVLTDNGKNVTLSCSGAIPVEAESLKGIEKVTDQLQPANLVISFDYVAGMIEKVGYNVEGNRFNLILSGQNTKIDPNKVTFSQGGANYDLIILIDTPKIEYLGKLLEHEQDIYSKVPTINIDNHAENENYATHNFVFEDIVSTSECLFAIITGLDLGLSKEVANLLLTGIKKVTNNLSEKVTAQTLERCAVLFRILGMIEGKMSPTETPDESWFAPKIYRSSKIIE